MFLDEHLVRYLKTRYKVSDETAIAVSQETIKKLLDIVEREGDANGYRRTPHYIKQLADEKLRQRYICDYTVENCRVIIDISRSE